MKVLLVDPVPPALLDAVRAHLPAGHDLCAVADRSPGELARQAGDAEVFLVIHRPLGAGEFALAPRLRFVQRLGAGYDNIDLAAARAASVTVATTPGANADAVAEHTVMLILAVMKRLQPAAEATRQGRWPFAALAALGVPDLLGATVGLVGAGRIGLAVARRLRPFGSRLLYTGRRRLPPGQEEALGLSWAEMAELLAVSDVVSLHLPLTPQTRGLFGPAALAAMKAGAILVNTARGEIVDEAALREAIVTGRLAGAGLDVLAREGDEGEGHNPFADLDAVVVTPHYAGASRGAQGRILATAAANLVRYLGGEPPLDSVTGPPQEGA